MTYRQFQRQHPEWPKRLEDATGRRVRARFVICTYGGERIPAGTELIVDYVSVGRVHLMSCESPGRFIRGVRPLSVDMLPASPEARS